MEAHGPTHNEDLSHLNEASSEHALASAKCQHTLQRHSHRPCCWTQQARHDPWKEDKQS